MKLVKGTTLAFVYEGGIMMGTDSRTTSCYIHNGNIKGNIITDEEEKIKKLSSHINLFWTSMGHNDDWEKMYCYVSRNSPRSIDEAVKIIKEYLHRYIKNQNAVLDECKKIYNEDHTFGTIIGGYDPDKGFQVRSVTLLGYDIFESDPDTTILTLGSGEDDAYEILNSANTYYGEHIRMTRQRAYYLALHALFYATFWDKYSGGTLNVIHVSKTTSSLETHNALQVYPKFYNLMPRDASDVHSRTFFVLYPTNSYSKLVWEGDGLEDLILRVWPKGGVDLQQHLEASHFVAKKYDFYFHRFVFKQVNKAIQAYNTITTIAPPLRHNAIEDYFQGNFKRSGSQKKPVYIGWSSEDLLKRICNMKDATNSWYCKYLTF